MTKTVDHVDAGKKELTEAREHRSKARKVAYIYLQYLPQFYRRFPSELRFIHFPHFSSSTYSRREPLGNSDRGFFVIQQCDSLQSCQLSLPTAHISTQHENLEWWGTGMVICLGGVRCRLAYGPADATATHCLLLQ